MIKLKHKVGYYNAVYLPEVSDHWQVAEYDDVGNWFVMGVEEPVPESNLQIGNFITGYIPYEYPRDYRTNKSGGGE